MNASSRWFLYLLSVIFLSGCGHVISQHVRDQADPNLTFQKVSQDPGAYLGKTVVWGGEIVETLNQKDGKSLMEVFQRPLNWRGEPSDTSPSEGRFLFLSDEYLDPYSFRKGRKVTVAGEILGEKIRPIGEMDYRYPLLASRQIYLWPVYQTPPYPYGYYGYYDPWWYYRPWYPWWGYPYGGGWGFRFHYRH